MPKIRINGAELYYEEHGSGAPPLVFAHGLLWSGRMFDNQVAAFKDRYRCITFDFRGQGQSEVTRGGYDMDTLAEDAAALIEALGAAPCHFLGLSMGGFVGLRLAARRPELIRSLILLETAASPEPADLVPKYRLFALITRWLGPRMVAGRVLPLMFGRKFIEDPARAAERAEWHRRAIANDRVGIMRATIGMIDRSGVEEELPNIHAPTLVISGDQDVSIVTERSRQTQERIAGARMVVIEGAGHTCTVEEPAAVNAAIAAFLKEI